MRACWHLKQVWMKSVEQIYLIEDVHKLYLLRMLALYSDTKVLYANKHLFDSLTFNFILSVWKIRWPHVLVYIAWRSHQVWLLSVLRYIRDKRWYNEPARLS